MSSSHLREWSKRKCRGHLVPGIYPCTPCLLVYDLAVGRDGVLVVRDAKTVSRPRPQSMVSPSPSRPHHARA
jgi:hypothetical protein